LLCALSPKLKDVWLVVKVPQTDTSESNGFAYRV
jgi:hypothetical protein